MERKIIRRRKSWLERNFKYIIIALIFLFIFQSMRGCLNTSSLERKIKSQNILYDSIANDKNQIINNKNFIISSKDSIIESKDNYIQYLKYELKIADVKVEAAEKRAKAIQSTAEKIRTNTTIKIEADTSRNKIRQILDTIRNN